MMVTFRCKRSGNFVRFTNENDIAGLRKHEGYEEVIDHAVQTKKQEAAEASTEVSTNKQPAKRGRPPKATEIVEI